jgi:hypothetical protein
VGLAFSIAAVWGGIGGIVGFALYVLDRMIKHPVSVAVLFLSWLFLLSGHHVFRGSRQPLGNWGIAQAEFGLLFGVTLVYAFAHSLRYFSK